MHDPQRMVLMSIIAAVVISIILFIYFKRQKKKNINYLFVLLLISIPPIVSIFRPGSYESGDLSLHTMRAMSFYNVFINEHSLPRWSAELNLGYGDTYFQFIYLLPYILISLFHLIGFTFLDSTKILLAGSFITSGVFMYIWAKEEFGEKGGITAAIFYLYAPYHLVDLHFRVTIAENLSFIYLPLLLFLTKKYFNQKFQLGIYIGLAVSVLLFILSHQATFLVSVPIIIGYALLIWLKLKRKKIQSFIIYFSALFLGLLLSAFYWIPIIAESKYIYQAIFSSMVTFTPSELFFYSPWRYGFLFQGHYGELSFLIGYTQLFIIFVALYLLLKRQILNKYISLLILFLAFFCCYLLMMMPIFKNLWDIIPLIKNLQYTYRLSAEITFFTAAIAGIVVTTLNKEKFTIILCIITILYTILNWGNRGAIPHITDDYLRRELLSGPTITGTIEPTAPIWVDPKKIDFSKRPKQPLEIINGEGKILEVSRKSTMHEYLVDAESNITLKENTFYFPGWHITANNNPYQFRYTEPKFPGVMIFDLKKGVYKINVSFYDTTVRAISKILSLTVFVIFTIFSIVHYLPALIIYRNHLLKRLLVFFNNTFYSAKSKK